MNEVPIHEIRIGERHRKDLGDLEEVAAWIRDSGLLHPIGVTPDKELVFGQRRLRACRDILGWQTIPARVVHVRSILEGEVAENLVRKDFTPSERVAIVDALRGYTHGGDRKSDQRRNCDVDPLTVEEAAKRVGFCRDDYYRAKKVVEKGVPELVQAMDEKRISVSAAAEIASADPAEQRSVLAKGVNHSRWVAGEVRKVKKLRAIERMQEEERRTIEREVSCGVKNWTVTGDQAVVRCHLLLTDPPQGVLPHVTWDNPPGGIESFTREWCGRWAACGANFIAIWWAQTTLFEARNWLDESLDGYQFQQMCICHYRNYNPPQGNTGEKKTFKRTWVPIFIYRKEGSDRRVTVSNSDLGEDLMDFDLHSANYPTSGQNGDAYKQHPCQKPLSALRWLIHGLTQPGEKVADCFCGSGTTGIAAGQLGRSFHGIEASEEYRKLAEGRIAAFANPRTSGGAEGALES